MNDRIEKNHLLDWYWLDTSRITLTLVVLLCLFWTVFSNASAKNISNYYPEKYDSEISLLYQNYKSNNVPDRISYFSQFFINKPYVLGSLGEGKQGKFDQSPLYRTDAFDCMTYVSNVLALSLAQDLSSFKKIIKQVRYRDGKVSYATRNHFASIDWNPSNTENGFIRDISGGIVAADGKPIFKKADRLIDKPAWFNALELQTIKLLDPQLTEQKRIALLNELREMSKIMQTVQSNLAYLPVEKLFDSEQQPINYIFDQIPSGTIIEIVRPNWQLVSGVNLNVSHIGFVIRTDQGLMLRHAYGRVKRVREESLIDYLKDFLGRTIVRGISLKEVVSAYPWFSYKINKV